jgi:hypothetical protein
MALTACTSGEAGHVDACDRELRMLIHQDDPGAEVKDRASRIQDYRSLMMPMPVSDSEVINPRDFRS